MDALYFPVLDNGMQLSRTAWGLSMFALGISDVLKGRKIIAEGFSYPYPDGILNLCTAAFMASDCQRMCIIDTDEVFKPQDVELLLSHDVPFISGLYPKKKPGLEFPVVPLESDLQPFADDGRPYPREVARCARGFLNVHRDVFELMKPHVPKYHCDETNTEQYLFWRGLPGGHSEDFAFCDLYRSLGGKILIDPRIAVKHEGSCSYPIAGTY